MDNDTILEIDDRKYVNPQTGLDERLQFVDALRETTRQNTEEINRDTYNLGSQVPSNVGGLSGAEGLWEAQYQTPQLDAQVADLRAVAQQGALNQAMQNLSDIKTNELKQAWRGYYARKKKQEDADRAKANGNGNGNKAGSNGLNKVATPEGTASGTVRSNTPGTSTVWTGQYDENGNPIIGVYDTEQATSGNGQPLATYGGSNSTTTSANANAGQALGQTAIDLALLNPLLGSAILAGQGVRKLFGWDK